MVIGGERTQRTEINVKRYNDATTASVERGINDQWEIERGSLNEDVMLGKSEAGQPRRVLRYRGVFVAGRAFGWTTHHGDGKRGMRGVNNMRIKVVGLVGIRCRCFGVLITGICVTVWLSLDVIQKRRLGESY